MKIGIVLSKTPGYSETFFRSKIEGLLSGGHEVILFVQKKEAGFDLCEVRTSNLGSSFLKRILTSVWAFISLFPHLLSLKRYIRLEREYGTSLTVIFKRVVLNHHILTSKTDWLHYGFATQAIGRECLAKAIGAKMAVSFRGFDISIYPLKHPNCYTRLWNHVDKVHTISTDLHKRALKLGLPRS